MPLSTATIPWLISRTYGKLCRHFLLAPSICVCSEGQSSIAVFFSPTIFPLASARVFSRLRMILEHIKLSALHFTFSTTAFCATLVYSHKYKSIFSLLFLHYAFLMPTSYFYAFCRKYVELHREYKHVSRFATLELVKYYFDTMSQSHILLRLSG